MTLLPAFGLASLVQTVANRNCFAIEGITRDKSNAASVMKRRIATLSRTIGAIRRRKHFLRRKKPAR